MTADQQDSPPDEGRVSFHYNREERLRKLKLQARPRQPQKRKRRRGFFIILFDLILVALVFYLLNRPVNLYVKKDIGDFRYQLNVSGIRGKKVLFGVTFTYLGEGNVALPANGVVTLEIMREEEGTVISRERSVSGTTIGSGESESVVFLLDEEDLPRRGRVLVFSGESPDPLFDERVRF
jgi:hypothetical protein